MLGSREGCYFGGKIEEISCILNQLIYLPISLYNFSLLETMA